MLDQHAERRTPIADVVLPHDLVAEALEDSAERVADDRRAEVTHVHLFRDVRGRVVDNDLVAALRDRHAEPPVARERAHFLGEEIGSQREVDEPGAGDLDPLANALEVELRDYGFGDLARRALECLGEAHREVRLVVRAFGAPHHGVDAGGCGAERRSDGRLEPGGQQGTRVCHGSFAGQRRGLYGQEHPQRARYSATSTRLPSRSRK